MATEIEAIVSNDKHHDHSADCILIIGASGYVGHYLLNQLHFGVASSLQRYSVIATYNNHKPYLTIPEESIFDSNNKDKHEKHNNAYLTYMKLDVSIESSVDNFINKVFNTYKLKPSIIINLGALSNVIKCEQDLELANSINCPTYFINKLKSQYINNNTLLPLFINFSTDHVYDGSINHNNNEEYFEESKVNPINNYGQSKQMFEKYLNKQWINDDTSTNDNNNLIIFRSSVIYGPTINQFFGEKVQKKKAKKDASNTNEQTSDESNEMKIKVHATFLQFIMNSFDNINKQIEEAKLAKSTMANIQDAATALVTTNTNDIDDSLKHIEKIKIFNNEYRNFVCIFDICETIEFIVENYHHCIENKSNSESLIAIKKGDIITFPRGTYNLGGPNAISRIEFANIVADICGFDKKRISTIEKEENKGKKLKPKQITFLNVPSPSNLSMNLSKLNNSILKNSFQFMQIRAGLNFCIQCINIIKLDSNNEVRASKLSLFSSVGSVANIVGKTAASAVTTTVKTGNKITHSIVDNSVKAVKQSAQLGANAMSSVKNATFKLFGGTGTGGTSTVNENTSQTGPQSKSPKKDEISTNATSITDNGNDATGISTSTTNNNNDTEVTGVTNVTEDEAKQDNNNNNNNNNMQMEYKPNPQSRVVRKIPIPNLYRKVVDRLSMEGLLKQANSSLKRNINQKDFINKLLFSSNGTDSPNNNNMKRGTFPCGIVFLSTLSLSALGIGVVVSTGIVMFRLDTGYEYEVPIHVNDKSKTNNKDDNNDNNNNNNDKSKNKKDIIWKQRWSGPCALLESGGSFGLGIGIGSKVDHVGILGTPRHVKMFITNGGQLTFSTNAGIAVINQGASVSVGGSLSTNRGKVSETKGATLKSYGANIGVGVSSTVISVRKDCNSKFYNDFNIKVKDIANGNANKYMKYNEDYQEIVEMLNNHFNVRPKKSHPYYNEKIEKKLGFQQ